MATQRDNWAAVKELFESALERDPAQRSSFLKERSSDASIRAEVERLLAEHDQADKGIRRQDTYSPPPLGATFNTSPCPAETRCRP
jgi:hypothetical protein